VNQFPKKLLLIPCLILFVVSCAHDDFAPDTLLGPGDPTADNHRDLEKTAIGDSGICDPVLHDRIEEYLNNDKDIVFMTFQETIDWSTGGVINATPAHWPEGYEIKMVVPAECVPPTYAGYESVQFGVSVPADGPGTGLTSVPFHFYPDGIAFQHQPELILAWPPWAGTPASDVISLINIQTEIHDGAVHYRLPDIMATIPNALIASASAPPGGWTSEDLSTEIGFQMPHFSRWELTGDPIDEEDGTDDMIYTPSGVATGHSCWAKYEPEIPDVFESVALN
jgi:hypothetical protein